MIGWLRGRVIESDADSAILLDVGGVGYELMVPLGTLGRAATDDVGLTELHVHTNVRDDAIELFGFATTAERAAFRTLITISKVGPKLAMAVLSAVAVDELAQLVERNEVMRLTKVPGVGKKTAERMVLELRGKLAALAITSRQRLPRSDQSPRAPASQLTVLQDALVRMGFKGPEAERAIAQIDDLDRPLSELLRESLAILRP